MSPFDSAPPSSFPASLRAGPSTRPLVFLPGRAQGWPFDSAPRLPSRPRSGLARSTRPLRLPARPRSGLAHSTRPLRLPSRPRSGLARSTRPLVFLPGRAQGWPVRLGPSSSFPASLRAGPFDSAPRASLLRSVSICDLPLSKRRQQRTVFRLCLLRCLRGEVAMSGFRLVRRPERTASASEGVFTKLTTIRSPSSSYGTRAACILKRCHCRFPQSNRP
jgi:hypothetical protein